MEEEAVFFTLQMTAPRHEIRAAFSIDSVRGWVYLEATMNKDLRSLLGLTPGVRTSSGNFKCEEISHDDGIALLKMRRPTDSEGVERWVQVRKGAYKGDVGFVLSTESWGVHLLLIPRLPLPSNPKRKRSCTRYAPALLDNGFIFQHYHTYPTRIGDDVYSFKGRRFEHGLVVISYDFDSVSRSVTCMPLNMFTLFRESRHPKLLEFESTFPRPSEWHFAEDDEVYILKLDIEPVYHFTHETLKPGVIRALWTNYADVDLASGEGVASVRWLDIRKIIRVSDFVKVTGGLCQGWMGWVISVTRDRTHSAFIYRLNDKEIQSSNDVEVRSTMFVLKFTDCAPFLRHLKLMSMYWSLRSFPLCLESNLVLRMQSCSLARFHGLIHL
jgi:hypothetical protein